MYGFPADLDLSPAIGQETTQFCVGAYDLQFAFGSVTFAIQSRVEIFREGSSSEPGRRANGLASPSIRYLMFRLLASPFWTRIG